MEKTDRSTKVSNFESLLIQWNAMIQQGSASQVRKAFRKLNPRRIPRSHLVEAAQIARRIGLPELIVQWLGPIIHSEKVLVAPATDQEKALFALGLFRIGSINEAQKILAHVNPAVDPQIRFYRGLVFIAQWQYGKAVPELKKYIKDPRLTEYSRLVGRLNLCAALVALDCFKPAEQEISVLQKKLIKANYKLLLGNLLEIRSQLNMSLGHFEIALRDLAEAGQLLEKADHKSQLLVDKWKVIIELRKNLDAVRDLSALQAVRDQALAQREWETLRECDLQQAIHSKDQDLLLKVYWGSKSVHYKARALNAFASENKILSSYCWYGTKDSNTNSPIDLVRLAPTRSLKKLVFALTREFYRPLKTAELFSFIYENEHYIPGSSPEKTRRLVDRCRHWLKEDGLPIEIVCSTEGYAIKVLGNAVLLLHQDLDVKKNILIPEIFFTKGFFTSKQFAEARNFSQRTARRLLRLLVKENSIEVHQRGPQTVYKKVA